MYHVSARPILRQFLFRQTRSMHPETSLANIAILSITATARHTDFATFSEEIYVS